MKRLQILIDDETDDLLARASATEGISKAAVIRQALHHELGPLQAPENDPLLAMVGVDDFENASIDDVVYSR